MTAADVMTASPAIPKRIQRKRSKGWRMPANTVYVGRPSKFGNPSDVLLELAHAEVPQ